MVESRWLRSVRARVLRHRRRRRRRHATLGAGDRPWSPRAAPGPGGGHGRAGMPGSAGRPRGGPDARGSGSIPCSMGRAAWPCPAPGRRVGAGSAAAWRWRFDRESLRGRTVRRHRPGRHGRRHAARASSLLDVGRRCAWSLATERDVVRRATLDPAGTACRDPGGPIRPGRPRRLASAAGWRRGGPRPGADPGRRPVRAHVVDRVHVAGGRIGLAVQSCGEAACRIRLVGPGGGSTGRSPIRRSACSSGGRPAGSPRAAPAVAARARPSRSSRSTARRTVLRPDARGGVGHARAADGRRSRSCRRAGGTDRRVRSTALDGSAPADARDPAARARRSSAPRLDAAAGTRLPAVAVLRRGPARRSATRRPPGAPPTAMGLGHARGGGAMTAIHSLGPDGCRPVAALLLPAGSRPGRSPHGPDPVVGGAFRPEPGPAVPLALAGRSRRPSSRPRSGPRPTTPTTAAASKAADLRLRSGGSNPIGYGPGATCGVNGLACFTRDAPNGFTMWLREQGHVFDWGTLKWCQAYSSPPNGCYDAETIALDEFGHVEGPRPPRQLRDDRDYEDAVVQTFSRTKPSTGWNCHTLRALRRRHPPVQYDIVDSAAKYSTCLDLDNRPDDQRPRRRRVQRHADPDRAPQGRRRCRLPEARRQSGLGPDGQPPAPAARWHHVDHGRDDAHSGGWSGRTPSPRHRSATPNTEPPSPASRPRASTATRRRPSASRSSGRALGPPGWKPPSFRAHDDRPRRADTIRAANGDDRLRRGPDGPGDGLRQRPGGHDPEWLDCRRHRADAGGAAPPRCLQAVGLDRRPVTSAVRPAGRLARRRGRRPGHRPARLVHLGRRRLGQSVAPGAAGRWRRRAADRDPC